MKSMVSMIPISLKMNRINGDAAFFTMVFLFIFANPMALLFLVMDHLHGDMAKELMHSSSQVKTCTD